MSYWIINLVKLLFMYYTYIYGKRALKYFITIKKYASF